MIKQTYSKEKARQLLTFYFRLIAEQAGLKWTNDNYSEMNELIDCLIKAAREEVKEDIRAEIETYQRLRATLKVSRTVNKEKETEQ